MYNIQELYKQVQPSFCIYKYNSAFAKPQIPAAIYKLNQQSRHEPPRNEATSAPAATDSLIKLRAVISSAISSAIRPYTKAG